MAAARITAAELIPYLKELWRKIQLGSPHATAPPIGEPIDIASLTVSDVLKGFVSAEALTLWHLHVS